MQQKEEEEEEEEAGGGGGSEKPFYFARHTCSKVLYIVPLNSYSKSGHLLLRIFFCCQATSLPPSAPAAPTCASRSVCIRGICMYV
jgi:hypothetical protein